MELFLKLYFKLLVLVVMFYHFWKGRIILLIVLILVSSLLFISFNNGDGNNYKKGIGFYSEKNYKKAIEYFNKTEKDSDFLIYLKCKSYYHLKKYDQAIDICTNQVKNDYLKEMQKVYLALSFHEKGIYDKSIKTAKTIKEKDNYIKFFKLKIIADSSFKLKKYKDAIKYYSDVIYSSKYLKYHKIKKTFLSDDFQEIIFINYFNSYYKMKQYSNCLRIFDKYFYFIKNDNNKKEILSTLHDIMQKEKIKIDNKTKFYVAQKLYYAGKKKEAGGYFMDLLSLSKKDRYTLKAYFFTALINKDNKVTFKKYLDGMIKIFSSSDLSLYHYARAYYLTGKWNRALDYYKKVITKGKSSEVIRISFSDLLEIYEKNNKKEYYRYVRKYY